MSRIINTRFAVSGSNDLELIAQEIVRRVTDTSTHHPDHEEYFGNHTERFDISYEMSDDPDHDFYLVLKLEQHHIFEKLRGTFVPGDIVRVSVRVFFAEEYTCKIRIDDPSQFKSDFVLFIHKSIAKEVQPKIGGPTPRQVINKYNDGSHFSPILVKMCMVLTHNLKAVLELRGRAISMEQYRTCNNIVDLFSDKYLSKDDQIWFGTYISTYNNMCFDLDNRYMKMGRKDKNKLFGLSPLLQIIK